MVNTCYNNKKNNLGYILIFLFLFVSPPLVFELFPGVPTWPVLYMLLFPPLILYALFNKLSLFKKEVYKFAVVWCSGWFLYLVMYQDTIYMSRIIMAVISVIVSSIILSLGIKRFCKYYVKIITIMAVAGAITFFAVFLLNLSPIFEYENVDGRPGYFFGITCTNVYTGTLGIIRYSGFFDEPGAMGLWGLYAILFNKLLFDNRKIEVILIFSLIFTFSIGFYISLVFYLFLFYFKWSQKKMLIPLIVLFVTAFAFIFTNEQFYNMTVGRLTYDDSTGTIVGNNRDEAQKNAIKYFKENPIFGIGAGEAVQMAERGVEVQNNIMSPFATDGLVGVLIVYFPFLQLVFKRHKNKTARNCLWVFSLTFFHRAVIFTVFNLVMYIILLMLINYVSKCSTKNIAYGK